MPNPIVICDQQQILTTSLLVAEKFDKKHFHVLRDIEKIIQDCPDKQFRQSNFGLAMRDIPGPKNSVRQEKMYNLTRDGFTMLAMGFTGKKAFLWKIAFINAFNRMDAQLNHLQQREHHAMLDSLFVRHPQWRETRDLWDYGFSTREMAALQQKNRRNVQRMLARLRRAGVPIAQRPQRLAA